MHSDCSMHISQWRLNNRGNSKECLLFICRLVPSPRKLTLAFLCSGPGSREETAAVSLAEIVSRLSTYYITTQSILEQLRFFRAVGVKCWSSHYWCISTSWRFLCIPNVFNVSEWWLGFMLTVRPTSLLWGELRCPYKPIVPVQLSCLKAVIGRPTVTAVTEMYITDNASYCTTMLSIGCSHKCNKWIHGINSCLIKYCLI